MRAFLHQLSPILGELDQDYIYWLRFWQRNLQLSWLHYFACLYERKWADLPFLPIAVTNLKLNFPEPYYITSWTTGNCIQKLRYTSGKPRNWIQHARYRHRPVWYNFPIIRRYRLTEQLEENESQTHTFRLTPYYFNQANFFQVETWKAGRQIRTLSCPIGKTKT